MSLGKRKDDKGETSEEVFQEDIYAGRDTGRDRREWRSGDIKGRCVILCENIRSCNQGMGAVGLRLKVVWGDSEY